MQKYLTYINTALIAVLLLLSVTGHPANYIRRFGAAPIVGTETQFYDAGLDTSNGIGGGKFYVNSNVVIASTSAGVAGTFTTIQATTSAVFASTTLTGNTSVVNLVSSATSTFKAPIVSTSTTQDTVAVCGASPTISGANGIGHVTLGSSASSTCTVTFGTAFNAKPVCTATAESTSTTPLSTTPAAGSVIITFSSSTALYSAVVDYACIGQ